MDTLLMAQQLQNITVQAPGFAGINSQDSPLALDQSFASIASNCVIDQYGRVGARKGYETITTNSSVLSDSRGIEKVNMNMLSETGLRQYFLRVRIKYSQVLQP